MVGVKRCGLVVELPTRQCCSSTNRENETKITCIQEREVNKMVEDVMVGCAT